MALVDSRAPDFWENASRLLEAARVWVTPTDTIFGLGARASDDEAAARIARLKGRPRRDFILLASDLAAVERLALLDPATRRTVESYWPGSITFVLRARGEGTVATRVPSDPFLSRWLRLVGEPMISTSCNRHGEPPSSSASAARELFGSDVDLYVEGPTAEGRAVSTLVDLTGERPVVLRAGAVSFD